MAGIMSKKVPWIILALLFLALAGVVTPIATEQGDDWKRTRAQEDLEILARALDAYLKTQPESSLVDNHGESLMWLSGDGELPSSNTFDQGAGGDMTDYLGRLSPDLPTVDPWGRSYLINLSGLHHDDDQLLVLSSGPNGQVNTRPHALLPGGDDLTLVLD